MALGLAKEIFPSMISLQWQFLGQALASSAGNKQAEALFKEGLTFLEFIQLTSRRTPGA
jgi:hypothetical protein